MKTTLILLEENVKLENQEVLKAKNLPFEMKNGEVFEEAIGVFKEDSLIGYLSTGKEVYSLSDKDSLSVYNAMNEGNYDEINLLVLDQRNNLVHLEIQEDIFNEIVKVTDFNNTEDYPYFQNAVSEVVENAIYAIAKKEGDKINFYQITDINSRVYDDERLIGSLYDGNSKTEEILLKESVYVVLNDINILFEDDKENDEDNLSKFVYLIGKIVNVEQEKEKLEQGRDNLISFAVKKTSLPREEMEERVDYLLENEIPEKTILKILSSMVNYKGEALKMIPKKPATPFINSGRILRTAISNVNIGNNLMLSGPMGVGKNVLAETIAWLYRRPLYEFSMNSGVNNMDLLGTQTLRNGNVVFEPSSIVKAVEYGGILVMDEFNVALPHVLSIFNSILDERRRVNVPGYKLVEAHKNFVVIGTQNPDYVGTFDQNEATLNRFYQINFIEAPSISKLVRDRFPSMPLDACAFMNNLFERTKKMVADGVIEPTILNIRGYLKAAHLVVEEDFPITWAIEDTLLGGIQDEITREEIKNVILTLSNEVGIHNVSMQWNLN